MSNRYKGGVISATPPTTNGPYENGAASGAWTLEQQMQAAAAGTWPTAGNIDPSAFIENLFSTYLYTGTGAAQTINNGIDLAGKGGLVWNKGRSTASYHDLIDTVRGADKALYSNTTDATSTAPAGSGITSFNSDGFTFGTTYFTGMNDSGVTSVAWTFREQAKFFDVVTYTGDGTDSRNISHNLATKPGFIVVKRTDSTGDWFCGARSGNSGSDYVYQLLKLNSTDARAGSNTGSTDTTFNVGAISPAFEASTDTNINGATYVAYLFAHNAGGFGLNGTDNVISCGSWTASLSEVPVNLGYEPQWVLVKRATGGTQSWLLWDTMRGMPVDGPQHYLIPNSSGAENTDTYYLSPTATGFTVRANALGDAGNTYIYIAIRRGPMKVPTDGTSVFTPQATRAATDGTATQLAWTAGFPVDMLWTGTRDGGTHSDGDKLRGATQNLSINSTNAEGTGSSRKFDSNLGVYLSGATGASSTQCGWMFRRAPSVFDEVCYTGTGVAGRTVTHNLGVAPELVITKGRNTTTTYGDWMVLPPTLQNLKLNEDTSQDDSSVTALFFGNGTSVIAPTSTVFTLGSENTVNESGKNFVAYLFATCPGVSKVGSYTGTGTTQTIDCGFTAGSRFVLIKRTDSTGGWYVWDSARGIVAGDDPYLLLNSSAAEVTSTDYVDTYSAGFEITSTAPDAINASGGTFIFLAIA